MSNDVEPLQTEFDAATLATELLRKNPVLTRKIGDALDCRDDNVPVALGEVLRFMFLVANTRTGQLTPSHRVDLAWHEFILCTKTYQDFCSSHFGRMIHHFPGGSKDLHRRQFLMTLQLYEEYFGIPDEHYWGTAVGKDDSQCGACESF